MVLFNFLSYLNIPLSGIHFWNKLKTDNIVSTFYNFMGGILWIDPFKMNNTFKKPEFFWKNQQKMQVESEETMSIVIA